MILTINDSSTPFLNTGFHPLYRKYGCFIKNGEKKSSKKLRKRKRAFMAKRGNIHIGTSGWQYDHWKGPFYPEELPKKGFLGYYAEHFHTVEINNSFYQLPKRETLNRWRESVPKDFIFSFKASRYITHMKKLKDPEQSLSRMLAVLPALDGKLGPILFQLPPKWGFDSERLYGFLDALPGEYRYVFELRDPSWLDPKAYEALTEMGAGFCIYELSGRSSPKEITADFVYIRLHGPADAPYKGQYSTTTLAGWAGAISAWERQGRDVFCYFDNDEAGYAPQDALRLQAMLGSK
jgi:uncharacterized protein YecE (DUF72 family)